MDHDSLQDLGIASVGHRLNLLRAVWELKRHQGMPMGEDDWRPQGVPFSSAAQSSPSSDTSTEALSEGPVQAQATTVDRLWDLILEQRMSEPRGHDI